MNRMRTRLKHTHEIQGTPNADLTLQASRGAYPQDGQQTDAYKASLAEYKLLILVCITDDEVCIRILRRGGAKPNQVKLIDFLQPPCFPETHLLPKLTILLSFTT